MVVKRIVVPLCLLGGLLLLPACMAKETSGSTFAELSSSQSSENQSIEKPTRTPTEPPTESSATSDTATYLPDESSLPSNIPKNATEAENAKVTSSKLSAVPSLSSEMSAAPQLDSYSYPSEVAVTPEMSISEPPDPLPPESSAVPSVEAMDSAYLCDLLIGVNSHRNSPLNMDTDLSATAQAHAEEMAQTKSLYHSCSGVESVGKGAFEDGKKEGSMLTVHCSDLASEELIRIGVGAARDKDGSIYVCILGKTY